MLQTARQPFDDVKLGPLLGKGGFGRVYRAVWNGAAVACKVVQFLKHFCSTSPSLLSVTVRPKMRVQSFGSDQVVHQTPCLVLQIIDVQPHAKATVATSGHEGEEDSEGMPIEALLGMDMAHPNVVQTYRHTSLPISVSPESACAAPTLHQLDMIIISLGTLLQQLLFKSFINMLCDEISRACTERSEVSTGFTDICRLGCPVENTRRSSATKASSHRGLAVAGVLQQRNPQGMHLTHI